MLKRRQMRTDPESQGDEKQSDVFHNAKHQWYKSRPE